MKAREIWLDYLRAFACILVTVGHLLMSFQEAHIVSNGGGLSILIRCIYCFHVYIFFFCSGYLFQKKQDVLCGAKKRIVFKLERSLNFLLVYVLFSAVTYCVKTVFSADVNEAVEYGFGETLLWHPINQMWYLYAIAVIFLFAYGINSQKSLYTVLGVALVGKMVVCLPIGHLPVPVYYLLDNGIWFVIGQIFAYKHIHMRKSIAGAMGILFVLAFALMSVLGWDLKVTNAVLTLLGILASVGIVYALTKYKTTVSGVWKYISKYMLQIYLLHTLCAAGVRIVLLKAGVAHFVPHLVLGLVFSFAAPIVCAVIAERVWVLNVVFFPLQTFKRICTQKKQAK